MSVPGRKDRLKRCWICISRFPSFGAILIPFPELGVAFHSLSTTASKQKIPLLVYYDQFVRKEIGKFRRNQGDWQHVNPFVAIQLVAQYPKDLVSLKRGQTLCFYMGRQEDMLNLALQVSVNMLLPLCLSLAKLVLVADSPLYCIFV